MYQQIQIHNMREADIDHAVDLWRKQYRLHCTGREFPQYWSANTEEIRCTLENQIRNRHAVVAKRSGQMVGFTGYYVFDFHGEKTAFCNIASHAAEEGCKEQIYLALYQYISKLWIGQNIFNHLWTFFYQDERLKLFLYDLGFGSYVVDAYTQANAFEVIHECPYTIRLAALEDLPSMQPLADESILYYEKEPLFLKRKAIFPDDLRALVECNNIFIACDGSDIVGLIHVSRSTENNPETLSVFDCALINELGAYIKPEYRGENLGAHLLNAVAAYCGNNSIDLIHVDFETANPLANRFWRKHFKTMLLSVRRTINKDANS